ncbi:MAG: preprotein translocase subunit YajC [Rhabdochlamydiaceae bacterium]|nr:preprotein translocase subunit YajC [Candidatus Amphrikana amoebophyrae]
MSPIIAEAAEAGAKQGNFTQTIIMVVVALLFFYFILWRPEQKRRKTLEARRNSLQNGDKVTAMGIVGKIVKMTENTVTISTGAGTEIEMLKQAVTEVTESSQSAPEATS